MDCLLGAYVNMHTAEAGMHAGMQSHASMPTGACGPALNNDDVSCIATSLAPKQTQALRWVPTSRA